MVKKIEIPIDLDPGGKAKRSAKELNDELGKTEKAIEDVESAGSKFARKLDENAAKIESDFRDATRMAETLANALGPEFSAKIGQNGLDNLVRNMRGAGLAADDVEADIDQLVASIKNLDQVGERLSGPQKGLADIDAKAKQVEGTSRAASVGIGGIGGSISELPGVGNLGAIAESMGQLAEGALEGDVNSKQLVGTLGLLSGTAAVMWGVQEAMQSIADTKAFNEEQAQAFKDVIEELGPGIDAVNKYLLETKAITGRAGGIGPFFEGTKDITATLIAAGISFNTFASAVESGGPKLDTVVGKLREKRDALKQEQLELQASGEFSKELNNEIEALGDAIEVTKETHKAYAGQLEETTAWQDWAAESARGLLGAQKLVKMAVEDLATATVDGVLALQDTKTAGDKATTSLDGFARAAEDAEEQFSDLTAALDVNDSIRDTEATFKDLKTAADTAFFAAVGGAEDAAEKQAEYEQKLDDTKRKVLELGDEIGRVPPAVTSSIQVLLDEGKLEEAERRILMLSTARQLYIDVIARGGGGLIGTATTPGRKSAIGGRYSRGEMGEVAEPGRPPEVWTGSDGRSYMIAPGNGRVDPLQPAASGGNTYIDARSYGVGMNEVSGRVAAEIAWKQRLRR